MLAVIVFYLLISGHLRVGLTDDKCLQAGVHCMRDRDCCSKICFALAGTTIRHCYEANEEVKNSYATKPSKVEQKYCIKKGHYCIANDDCCDGICELALWFHSLKVNECV